MLRIASVEMTWGLFYRANAKIKTCPEQSRRMTNKNAKSRAKFRPISRTPTEAEYHNGLKEALEGHYVKGNYFRML
jgi:hypothetical protein